jgi:hypothetical protein
MEEITILWDSLSLPTAVFIYNPFMLCDSAKIASESYHYQQSCEQNMQKMETNTGKYDGEGCITV